MLWYIVHTLTSLLFDFLRLMQLQPAEKDAEMLLLRQQLLIVRRRQKRGPNISCFEKLVLISLLGQIQDVNRAARTRLEYLILIFRPATILRWHRALVRPKWTFDNKAQSGGRPPIDSEIEALIVRLARENPWGAGKIQGELLKLGYRGSQQTILNVLKRHNLYPLPQRKAATSWQAFLSHY